MIPIYTRRRIINAINLTFSFLAMLFGLFWLFWILWTLLDKGLSGISLDIFTQMTPSPGSTGGLLNAIVGSLVLNSASEGGLRLLHVLSTIFCCPLRRL